jgi:hypothetical protein
MGARIVDGFTTYGSGQTSISTLNDSSGLGYLAATSKTSSSSPGTVSASGGEGDSVDTDWTILAIKPATPVPVLPTPTIMDNLPLTMQQVSASTTGAFTYTVPSGGTNTLEVVMMCMNRGGDLAPTATQNGKIFSPFVHIEGTVDRCTWYYAYLANPSSGTFRVNFQNVTYADFIVFTLQGAEQVVPDDPSSVSNAVALTATTSIVTTVANDFLLSMGARLTGIFNVYGPGQSEIANLSDTGGLGYIGATWKAAATGPNTETTSGGSTNSNNTDWAMVGFKPAPATTTNTIYCAKVDDGSHNEYSFANNTWTMYDKKGTRYLYGSDDTGRMYDTTTSTSTKTYRWVLQEVRDANNNYVKYTYLRDGNVLYPNKITYTGYNTTDGPFAITFATSTRPDVRVTDDAGFVATTSSRISQITTAVNGTNVRQYNLSYTAGNNGYRSLLSGVGQIGWDDNGVLATTSTTTFSYLNSVSQFYAPANLRVANSAYVVADANGNGENDTTVIYSGGAHVWTDNAFAGVTPTVPAGVYWAVSTSTSDNYTPQEQGVRLIDTNADGKPDLIVGYKNGSTETFAEYLNQYSATTSSYSWTSTSTWLGSIPHFGVASGSNYITTGIFGDVNGDGLPDYLTNAPGFEDKASYLSNGKGGWDKSVSTFIPQQAFPSSGPTASNSQLTDVNGDGLDDWSYSDGVNTYVLINNGSGWNTSPDPYWTLATSSLYSNGGNYYDRGIRFIDINGDGLPDMVRAYQNPSGGNTCSGAEIADVKAVFLNTGHGWATSTAYTLPSYITYCGGNNTFTHNEYVNFNGNGQLNQDVLSTVANSKGGTVSVTYAPTGGSSSNGNLPISLLTTSQVVTNDGRGNYATTTYSYAGGELYLASGPRNRKFAGFQISTTTAPDSVTATYYNQGDNVYSPYGERSDGYGQINHPSRQDVFDLSNSIMQRTFYRWDTIAHGLSTFVGLGRQMTESYAPDGTHRDKATNYSYSSTTDDLIQQIDYGEVTGNSDGTLADTGTDARTTNYYYTSSSSVNMSVPIEKTLFDYNSSTSSDEKVYYDSLPFGQVNVGNSTRQEDWISGTTYASTTKTYTAYGLVATSTDRNGNATSYVYDANNLYAATTTNPLLQKTQAYYNLANGKIKQSTDPNSRLTKNIFDGLGRLTEVDQSSTSTPSAYATSTTYVYSDSTSTPSMIHRADYLTGSSIIDTYDYYDGFNRLIQERKQSPISGTFIAFDKKYNQVGLVASSSLPYFSTGSGNTTATRVSNLYTNYLYDPLQRPLTISNIVGTTTNAYAKWTTTTTDANGHITADSGQIDT